MHSARRRPTTTTCAPQSGSLSTLATRGGDDRGGVRWPSLRAVARHALPHVIEATLIPLALFYLTLWIFGKWPALMSALVWSVGAIACRVAWRRRVPGILILGTLTLTVRTGIALASGSIFVYFLQPIVVSLVLAVAFIFSLMLSQSLVGRLAADFCPLPPGVADRPRVRRLFRQLSVLWGFLNMATAAVTLWLLMSQSLPMFMLAKTSMAFALDAAGTITTVCLALRAARREGLRRAPTRHFRGMFAPWQNTAAP